MRSALGEREDAPRTSFAAARLGVPLSDEAQVPEGPPVPLSTEEGGPEPRRWTWPAKTAEFFVIVISILVALAGDAWWDGRVARREEHDALVALR